MLAAAVSSEPDPTPPRDPAPLKYAEPDTPRPPFRSDEPETWADVLRALGIVVAVLIALFLVIAMTCGGLL
jgi:hypothetical protein